MSEIIANEEPVDLTIIHSSNGTRQQVHIPLSSTLQVLKDEISKHPSVENSEQRIFFLGRELKSNRKSLSSLGIGNRGIFILHLHVKKALAQPSKGKNEKKKSSSGLKQDKQTNNSQNVIELIESSPRSRGTRRKRTVLNNDASQSTAANTETIDLLEDEGESQGQTTAAMNRRVKGKNSNGSSITTIDLSEG